MVPIYEFFVKRKSNSHKKLRFHPILPPYLLRTPSFRAIFAGVGGGFSRPQPALWWMAFVEGCGGWRWFCASTTRAMVGGLFGGVRGLAGVSRALRLRSALPFCAGSPPSARVLPLLRGFSRLINLPNLLILPKLPKFPNLPIPHNVRFAAAQRTQPRTSRTPHTLPHPL